MAERKPVDEYTKEELDALGDELLDWPLDFETTHQIVEFLMDCSHYNGLILANKLNMAMGASARRSAVRKLITDELLTGNTEYSNARETAVDTKYPLNSIQRSAFRQGWNRCWQWMLDSKQIKGL